jgi:hypothetical protein
MMNSQPSSPKKARRPAIPAEYSVNCFLFYPALGEADARNEGVALRALPLAIPHGVGYFLQKLFSIRAIYFVKSIS